ncbi:hypothetical protein [Colwellia piezophila]|uniref:hypothetical protein n=1 Tax=Colwellia piezophila TaxID=211668 RepID=UPI000362586E|nr:hypothetical protein [Colwellia piezophila]
MLNICQETQVLLSRQFQQKTLAHAILLQGIEGTGKPALAKWLIELLICKYPISFISDLPDHAEISQACNQCKSCLLRKSGSYPDHLLLSSDNKTLGVDDIRRGNSFLEKTAHLGQIKTILIPQAQTMTVAAANALLKTLEEPSQNSFIVLLSEDLDSLLPTIVSRCAIYTIRPVVGEALLLKLKSSGFSEHSLPQNRAAMPRKLDSSFVNLSQLAELTDAATFQAFEEFNQRYLDYLTTGQSEPQLLIQLIENKHGLRWLEKITCNLVRQHYLTNGPDSSNSLATHQDGLGKNEISELVISPEVLNQIYQAIISSNKLIKSFTQANRQFVAEQLLMTINTIVRPST